MIESLNPRTRSVVVAIALIIVLGMLILAPISLAQAISVEVSEMPDHLSLGEEATMSIVVDPEEAEFVQMVDVELVVSHPSKGIIASGSFYPNGTMIDDGDFIVSVSLEEGAVLQGQEYDITAGVRYSVRIEFSSQLFQPSTDNELTVFVNRGVNSSRLRAESVTFDILGQDAWPIVIMAVAAVELVFFLTLIYAARKRGGKRGVVVRKRKLRGNMKKRRLRKPPTFE